MRKLATLLIVGTLMAPAMAAGAPGGSGQAQQFAFANWTVKEDGMRVIYFASGMNGVPGEWPSIGFIGRAECKRVEHDGRVHVTCRGRSRPTQLNPGDFVVDPTLATAQLKVTQEDVTHQVNWAGGDSTAEPFWHQHAGTDVGVLFQTALQRRLPATATIYGNDLPSKRGFIGEGGYVEVWLDYMDQSGFGQFRMDDGDLVFRKVLR